MAGIDRLVSRRIVPARPMAAMTHPVAIILIPSSMNAMPRPSTIPTTTKRGTSAAILRAVPVNPRRSQIKPVARPAPMTAPAVIVAV